VTGALAAVAATPKADWYLMRGSGLVALVLLSATVFLGVVGTRRWQSPRWPRFVTAGLHRSVALLAVCFVALHVVTAVLDSWVGVGWLDVVVPFRSPYRPLWVGLGAVAVDLAVAVTATSLLRRHLGHRTWRAVHWASWLLWPVALVHAVGAGTDTRADWGLAVVVGCAVPVLAAAAWRLATRQPTVRQPAVRQPAARQPTGRQPIPQPRSVP